MSGANVLVVFYSRRGKTEALALAAGVGAIQVRGSVRLRRLPDLATAETIAADAAWTENLERMKKDYIAPREIDAQWANVLILAAPKDCTAEMERYLESAAGLLREKKAAVLGGFEEAAARAGLKVVPGECTTEDSAVALSYGRAAAGGMLA
jgi:NAD(P)H dehydrogenase (quinone)